MGQRLVRRPVDQNEDIGLKRREFVVLLGAAMTATGAVRAQQEAMPDAYRAWAENSLRRVVRRD
jgi:hypothetical protein